MRHETRFSPPAVGGSSLLVVFAVLALSVFALLSLSTVQAEARMSDASAQAVEVYYAADLQAEQIFARLRNGEQVPDVQEEGGIYRYTCPVSQSQRLIVELSHTEGIWEILRWQTVAEATPTGNESLPVWDGTASQEVDP